MKRPDTPWVHDLHSNNSSNPCPSSSPLTSSDSDTLSFTRQFDVKYPGPGNSNSNCRALVEMKGKNVLDGLCHLGKNGFIKFPLPRHLSSVVSLAQNSFTVKDKT
ncbi:centromere protein n-like [Plakobranchus ocellatus]|uniref:Centromere protein n-like n=1 Tax=Plakobranchus ocellatus TaxID=259542 RepID=A0AAV3Y4U5_9GAST|nr:centromere protein n-like [Plakobranchus ocellatus]